MIFKISERQNRDNVVSGWCTEVNTLLPITALVLLQWTFTLPRGILGHMKGPPSPPGGKGEAQVALADAIAHARV